MAEILVPLDGSSEARRALALAAALAKGSGSALRLVQAISLPATGGTDVPAAMLGDAAKEYLAGEALAVRQKYGLPAATAAEYGFAPQFILALAGGEEVDCIVMATHGRTGLPRAVLGSVSEEVLRRSPVPVFLVPPAAKMSEPPKLNRLLVPLDGSDRSYSVLAPITRLARELPASVILLRVYRVSEGAVADEGGTVIATIDRLTGPIKAQAAEYLGPIQSRLRAAGIPTEAAAAAGEPAPAIIRGSVELQADLVALATHGRSGLQRLRHGSVAEAVLRHSAVPVMTFGPAALRRLEGAVVALAGSSMPEEIVERVSVARPTTRA